MALIPINKGTGANNGTGTPARQAADIINSNFAYLLGLIKTSYPIILIDGRPFELRKTVNLDDPDKANTLEDGDVVFGTPAAGQYRMMRYNGGDATDFDNDEVYTIITGI